LKHQLRWICPSAVTAAPCEASNTSTRAKAGHALSDCVDL
jgi:hypothetical protein